MGDDFSTIVPALAWAAGQLLEATLTRGQAAGELDVPLDDEPETEAGAW
jgi:hypothetical protein